MVDYHNTSLDAVLAAVADPTRRGILHRLTDRPVTIAELASPLPMSLQAVSKHVGVLEKAGLAVRERRGREHFVTIRPGPLKQIETWMSFYQRFWTQKLDALARYVEAPSSENATAEAAAQDTKKGKKHVGESAASSGRSSNQGRAGKHRRG